MKKFNFTNIDPNSVRRCNKHPDHFIVPGFNRYCVNPDGRVMACKINLFLKPQTKISNYRGVGGYKFHHLINDESKGKSVQRHRLVLASCRGSHVNRDKVYVNRINGIPGDDRLDNLEWVTLSENSRHAYDTGLRDDFIQPMEAWNVDTNEIARYKSVPDFVRKTGMPVGTIRKRLVTPNNLIYNGFRYRYTREEWLPFDSEAWYKHLGSNDKGRDIIVHDVLNCCNYVFESAAQACRFLGINAKYRTSVVTHCRNKVLTPYYGYIFRWLDEHDGNFPKFSESQKLFMREVGDSKFIPPGFIGWDGIDPKVFCPISDTKEIFGYHPTYLAKLDGQNINGIRIERIMVHGKIETT